MRICVDFSLNMVVMLYSQFMQENDSGETKAENIIHVKTAVLDGKSALMFHSNDKKRYAWAIWDDSVPAWLVWFGKEEDVLSVNQDNLYPNIKECESAYVILSGNVTSVINDYITKDIKPSYVMPRGYVDSTSGFNEYDKVPRDQIRNQQFS